MHRATVLGKPSTARHAPTLTTEEEIFESCVEHLHEGYNGGKIRPMITIFRAAGPGCAGIRFWNSQLIRYAGYRNADGSVTGDPLNPGAAAYGRPERPGVAGRHWDSL